MAQVDAMRKAAGRGDSRYGFRQKVTGFAFYDSCTVANGGV